MSKSIGKIEELSGKANVVSPDGASSPAVAGMAIATDSVVTTEAGSAMMIRFSDGTTMNIGADEFVLIDKTVSDSEALAEDETQAEVDTLKAILAENPDLSVFEETASGEAVAVGGSSLIVDSIEKHNDNSSTSGSSSLEQFASNKHTPAIEDDDQFGLVTDTTSAVVGINNILTNDNTPTINGTISDSDATVVVTVGGNDYTAINNGDGTWTLPITDTISDGTTTIIVVATDPTGNETTETAEITVDTIDPTVTIDPVNSNDTTPIITGTTDDNTATIVVTINGEDHTATNNADGTWTLPVTDTLPEGETEVTVVATDPAGNSTTETEMIIIDTTAPTLTVDTTPTSDATPIISGTITEGDATIVVTIGGTDYDATNNGDGTWSVPITDTLPDGENTITVEATDPAGNTSTETVILSVDTTAPIITIDDLVTNDTTPTITGTTDDITATITITIDGKAYDGIVEPDGKWSVTLPDGDALSDNDYVVSVTATDPLGNTTNVTDSITIDTNNSDSGDAKITLHEISDNFINAQETTQDLVIKGTSTATEGSVVTIEITEPNGTIHNINEFLVPDPIITVDAAGQFSVTFVASAFSQFSDGDYTVTASVIADAAGNVATSEQAVTLDTTLTDIIDEGGDNDNGGNVITIDSIEDLNGPIDFTNGSVTTEDKTIIIKGTYDSEPDTHLVLTIDGVVYTPVINGKEWTLDLSAEPLSAHTHEIIAQVVDDAGNHVEVSKDIVITPVTGVLNVESITDDTGLNGADFITQDTTLIISGSMKDATNNTLAITIDGTTYTDADTELTVNNDGTWSLDLTDPSKELNSDGNYALSVSETEAGTGNVTTITQNITTDNTGPNDDNNSNGGNVVTIGTITEDTGVDNNDFITTDKTLLIEGTFDNENGNRFDLSINGQPQNVVINGNNWSLDLQDKPFSDGTYTLSATVTDIAGNTVTEQKDIVIDTTIDPTQGDVTIDLDEISNNFINLDETTSDTLIAISGTTINATDGTIVTIRVEGNVFTTAIVTNNTFSALIPKDTFNNTTLYPDGTYDVSAEVVADAAGNISIDHEDVLLDRSNTDDNGNGNGIGGADATVTLNTIGDGIINIEESSQGITITGTTTLVAGNNPEHTIVIELNGKSYIATPIGNNLDSVENTFTVNIPATDLATLGDASDYTITATIIADKAGNAYSDQENISTDYTAPDVTVDDLNTQDNTPAFTGTINDPTAVIIVNVGGKDYTAINNGDGSWTLADNAVDPLTSPSTIDITVTATDLAGNATTATTSTGTITIDKLPEAFDNVDNIDLANTTTTSGNVITDEYNSQVDSLGDGTTSVSSITYEGETYTFTNGSLAIDTAYGDILFQDDGSYTYNYTGPDAIQTGGNSIDLWDNIGLYAFQNDDYLNGGKLDPTTLASHTSDVSENSKGLGVADSGFFSSDSINGNDALVLEFADNISEVKLHINDTALFNFFAGTTVTIYDAEGNVLDTQGNVHFLSFFGSADDTYQIDMGDIDFKYVVIESSSKVYVDEVSYTPAVTTTTDVTENFTYEITDTDGDTSTASLTIDGNNNTITYDSNALLIDGGLGIDTLLLTTNDNLDFSNVSNLHNMEIVDLSVGDHAITNLEVADILNMTDDNNILTIYGDNGDSVSKPTVTTDTWTKVDTGVDDGNGHTVDVYNVSDGTNTVTVNIEQEIIVS